LDTVRVTGFSVVPEGPFSLEEAALFGFGQRHETSYDGTMRMAFCVDGLRAQAGVAVTQDAAGVVHGEITAGAGDPDPDVVAAQVGRVLSLNDDAHGYVAVGDRDPVIARLLAAAPGLRPPLFYSPFEAAFWAVLSSRRPRRVGEAWRHKIAAAAGAPLEVAGSPMWALPTPSWIVAQGPSGLVAAAGIETARAERLCGVAAAALDGSLEAGALAAMDPGAARRHLRGLPGIGPFYADLILVRSTGVTDLLPAHEPRLLGLLGDLYGIDGPATAEDALQLAETWRPWRTWVAVLVRAAGGRVLGRTQGPIDPR
jgi:DNA-3-methyladenine glycosylase II